MRILEAVLKNDDFSNYINESKNIDEAFDHLKNNFKLEHIYNTVVENINYFVVEGDIETSYEKIKKFSKDYTISILSESAFDFDLDIIFDDLLKHIHSIMNDNVENFKYGNSEKSLFKLDLPDKSDLNDLKSGFLKFISGSFNSTEFKQDIMKYVSKFKNIDDDTIKNLQDNIFSKKYIIGNFINQLKEKAMSGQFMSAAMDEVYNKLSNTQFDLNLALKTGKLWKLAAITSIIGGLITVGRDYLVHNDLSKEITISTQIVGNLIKGNFQAILSTIKNEGIISSSLTDSSSTFDKFKNFMDNYVEKSGQWVIETWEKAKNLALSHPYAAIGILTTAALGIVYKVVTKNKLKH